MITQRAVSWRLRQEGIQHLTDLEDMSNAFACTSANCRAEVLEELINEVDRSMFFERILNSTVLYESDEDASSRLRSVATSWVRVRVRTAVAAGSYTVRLCVRSGSLSVCRRRGKKSGWQEREGTL